VTHEVFNQPPPLVDYDSRPDAALLEAWPGGAPWAVGDLHRLGKLAARRSRSAGPTRPTGTSRA
jgi:putative acyl-CoA dehydrogenase